MKKNQETLLSQLSDHYITATTILSSKGPDNNCVLEDQPQVVEANDDYGVNQSTVHEFIKAHNNALNKLTTDFAALGSSITLLEDKVCGFDGDLDYLFERVAEGEQYSGRESLLFHGLPDVPNDRSEMNMIAYMAWKINTIIPRRFRVSPAHISTAHILQPRNKRNRRPIVIVKFAYRWLKNEVFKDKNWVRDRSVSFTEHLTYARLSSFKKAQRELGAANVFTNECNVLFDNGSVSYKIRNSSDIEKCK